MVEVSNLGKPVHLGTAPVYLGKYLSMFESDYQLGDGSMMRYTVASRHQDYHPSNVKGTDAVTLFVISKNGDKMLLIDEYRYPVGDYVVSVPSGMVDSGEEAIESARRELIEETGYYEILGYKEMPATYSSVGMTDERVKPFIIRVDEDKVNSVSLGTGEVIQSRWVSQSEAMEIAFSGENVTARTQLALVLFANGVFQGLV